jgi:phosphoglycolate phosphatase-like HAD superfamily hydrolase
VIDMGRHRGMICLLNLTKILSGRPYRSARVLCEAFIVLGWFLASEADLTFLPTRPPPLFILAQLL